MRAMILEKLVSLAEEQQPLRLVEWPDPEPSEGEIRIAVSVCGVCHTELDEIEGRTPPPTLPIILGHEVVGRVDKLGPGAKSFRLGDRVGVGWIHASTGTRDENLRPEFRATGRDAHGGYAEYMVVGERYAYPIPSEFADEQAAPLLCAGAVGYRALQLTGLHNGEPLGITGFGGSGHLMLQFVRHHWPQTPVSVFARDQQARQFALELGAAWSGATTDRAPEPLRAIIDTTPAWQPVVEALGNLAAGGRLIINAIRKEDRDKEALLNLSYADHLWMERELKTVANVTHFDIGAFLPLAAQVPLQPHIELYPLEEANRALIDLRRGPVRGAKVLRIR